MSPSPGPGHASPQLAPRPGAPDCARRRFANTLPSVSHGAGHRISSTRRGRPGYRQLLTSPPRSPSWNRLVECRLAARRDATGKELVESSRSSLA